MKNIFKKPLGILFLSGLVSVFIISFAINTYALSNITASLDIGSRGNDVTTLQTFLSQDSSIYPQQLVTGYYGSLTANAVKNFQARYGIEVVGRVGPITRAKINNLITNGGFGSGGPTASVSGQAPSITSANTSLSASYTPGTLNSSVVVSWQTDRNARGKVYYSTSPLVLTETSSPTMEPTVTGANVMTDDSYTTSKSITLPNLWPSYTNSQYYYMIESIDANGNVSVTWPRSFNSSGVSSQY